MDINYFFFGKDDLDINYSSGLFSFFLFDLMIPLCISYSGPGLLLDEQFLILLALSSMPYTTSKNSVASLKCTQFVWKWNTASDVCLVIAALDCLDAPLAFACESYLVHMLNEKLHFSC